MNFYIENEMETVIVKSKKKIQPKNYRELLYVENFIVGALKLLAKSFGSSFLAKFVTRLVGCLIKVKIQFFSEIFIFA